MATGPLTDPPWQSMRSMLAALPALTHLPETELDLLAHASRVVEFHKGRTVFAEGQTADGIWVIESGRIEIVKYTTGGRAMAIESAVPGHWIGMLCRISTNRKIYPCTAVAATDCRLICIQEVAFWPILERFHDVLGDFCRMCSRRLSELSELPATAMEPSDKRVIKTLLRLADEHGPDLPFSKREISELAGTAPETTIRVLGALERRRWLTSSRGRLSLKCIDKLQSYLSRT